MMSAAMNNLGVKVALLGLSALFASLARPPSFQPLDLTGPALGLVAGGAILALERALRGLRLRVLLGGVAGLLVGGMLASLVLALLPAETLKAVPPAATRVSSCCSSAISAWPPGRRGRAASPPPACAPPGPRGAMGRT